MTKKFSKRFSKIMESCEHNSILGVNHKDKIVKICAWCDKDKTESEKWDNRGYTVSHGVCDTCSEKLLSS